MTHFFALDGIDGCGKSTQTKLLQESLQQKFGSCQLIRHPGGTALGTALRELLLVKQQFQESYAVEAQLLLFQADAVESAKYIAQHRAKGIPCIADRWIGSTWAFQGADMKREMVMQDLNLHFFPLTARWPNIYFIIDDSLANCQKRLEGKKKDFFESKPLDYHINVKNRFIDFANKNIGQGVIVLRAEDRTISEVHDGIIKVINNNLHLDLKSVEC